MARVLISVSCHLAAPYLKKLGMDTPVIVIRVSDHVHLFKDAKSGGSGWQATVAYWRAKKGMGEKRTLQSKM